MAKFKFTHQCVSSKVFKELCEFLHRDDISRPSSCQGVLVEGQETAVRYWQETVKGLTNQLKMTGSRRFMCRQEQAELQDKEA